MTTAIPGPGPLEWRWCRFDALSVHELQGIYAARQRVFVVEQGCAFLDADEFDLSAFHLAAWRPGIREPLAYARVLDPGSRYSDVSIGRVITAMACRRTGLGHEVVGRAVAGAESAWPAAAIRISAQSRLESFYAFHGFAAVGGRYSEDGIDHTEMVRDQRSR